MRKLHINQVMDTDSPLLKKVYIAPHISYILFELENCIATASTQVSIGENPSDIQVEDWTEKEDTQFFDF